jgi:acyl-CoA synthetase (AMP-forming)/AMP-acid ligase II
MMLGLPVLAAGATWSMGPVGAGGARWRRTAVARRATVGYAVPATLDAALRDGPLPGSFRLLATGGAPVTPAVVGRLLNAAPRARVVGVYGLTEALPVATVEGPDVLQHSRSGAGLLVGRPVPGTRVGVDDAGELWVAGPQVATGYLGGPPLDRVLTGDLARLTADGQVELLGRGKDMLLRGVTNIYPALVEPLVEAEPLVTEAAMVGVADPSTGDERVVLVVAPVPGTSPARVRAALRRRLPQMLDAAWLPDEVVVVRALPRAGRAGKVDKAALRTGLRLDR